MKRHSAIIPLSHDHHQALILANAIKKNAAKIGLGTKTIEEKLKAVEIAYKTELIPHFNHEEVLLFPLALGRSKELDAMISGILAEHNQIDEMVKSLKVGDLEENLNNLGILLDQHIRKEERVVFPEIEKIVGEEGLNILKGQIIAVKDSCGI